MILEKQVRINKNKKSPEGIKIFSFFIDIEVFEAKMGEIMVSCEKIRYTIRTAEDYLKPEQRGVCQLKILLILGFLLPKTHQLCLSIYTQ